MFRTCVRLVSTLSWRRLGPPETRHRFSTGEPVDGVCDVFDVVCVVSIVLLWSSVSVFITMPPFGSSIRDDLRGSRSTEQQ
jgi:hypothetical protein